MCWGVGVLMAVAAPGLSDADSRMSKDEIIKSHTLAHEHMNTLAHSRNKHHFIFSDNIDLIFFFRRNARQAGEFPERGKEALFVSEVKTR